MTSVIIELCLLLFFDSILIQNEFFSCMIYQEYFSVSRVLVLAGILYISELYHKDVWFSVERIKNVQRIPIWWSRWPFQKTFLLLANTTRYSYTLWA